MADLTKDMLSAVENDLRSQVDSIRTERTSEIIEMMTYHMGWTGQGAGQIASGKRLRPLFNLLSFQALLPETSPDLEWKKALPAATAIELIHNFSLIHDDIEDNSDKRRGRETVWKKWGIPQAINTGDAMFTLAHHAMHRLRASFPAESVLRSTDILLETCTQLTNGQFLDMSYETRDDLDVSDYWPMIEGKTAALISSSSAIGAILSGADETNIAHMALFGKYLGLAFQIQDDLLGIWGEESKTGKSAASDLLNRKKSYPILLSLSKKAAFFKAWSEGTFTPEQIPHLTQIMRDDGTYHEVKAKSLELTRISIENLSASQISGQAGELLTSITHQLLDREI